MIVIHGKSMNNHCVSKSTSRLASALPEPEANKSELKGANSDEELVSTHKTIKTVRFADNDQSYECDKSQEEIFTTWLTVSCFIDCCCYGCAGLLPVELLWH